VAPHSGATFHGQLLDPSLGARFVVAVRRATAALDGRTLDLTDVS
jgi:hypothetical protein